MSGALTGLTALAGVGGQALSSLGLIPAFIRQPRSIGTIIPDVTIEEHFSDRAVVTLHPVATGSQISDHMYLLPRTVVMKCGWTNANPVGGIVEGIMSGSISEALGSLTESRATTIYNKLLALQASRKPFTLTCGKRTYGSSSNSSSGGLAGLVSQINALTGPSGALPTGQMVITELSVSNDHHTEYALIIECHMQEVVIVNIGNVNAPAQKDQAIPQTTQPPTDSGSQQPKPFNSWGGFGLFPTPVQQPR